MEENVQPQQEDAAKPAAQEQPGAASRASAYMLQHGRALGQALPRLGLFLFILLTPLLITGYPAYFISAKLLDYAAATSIDAKLKDIEIKTVTAEGRDTSWFSERRHIEIIYSFRGEDRNDYVAKQQASWPAPGLTRKMEGMYEAGDAFVLYRMPDGEILLDQDVAKHTFLWLTSLMALIFAASSLFFLEWKRLHRLKPGIMPAAPLATAKSLGIAQLVALLIAIVQAVIVTHAPMTVPITLFLGVYWGLVVFLTLLLRLLLFDTQVPESAPKPDQEKQHPAGITRPR